MILDVDAQLTDELLALSDFARREAPRLIESYINGYLPRNLSTGQEELSSFAMSLVPDIFDQVLQQWDRSRSSSHKGAVQEDRSESGYASQDPNVPENLRTAMAAVSSANPQQEAPEIEMCDPQISTPAIDPYGSVDDWVSDNLWTEGDLFPLDGFAALPTTVNGGSESAGHYDSYL
jgi:hypothetical protein